MTSKYGGLVDRRELRASASSAADASLDRTGHKQLSRLDNQVAANSKASLSPSPIPRTEVNSWKSHTIYHFPLPNQNLRTKLT